MPFLPPNQQRQSTETFNVNPILDTLLYFINPHQADAARYVLVSVTVGSNGSNGGAVSGQSAAKSRLKRRDSSDEDSPDSDSGYGSQ